MTTSLTDLAIWATPVLLAIIGFFFQREFNKQDDKFTEIFHLIRDEFPREYIRHSECTSCQKLADERRLNCKEVVGKMEKNIGGLAEQMEKLDECVKVVGAMKC